MTSDKQSQIATILGASVDKSLAPVVETLARMEANQAKHETSLNAILLRLAVLEEMAGKSGGENAGVRPPRGSKKTSTTTTTTTTAPTTTTTVKSTKPASLNITSWAMLYNWENATEADGVKTGALDRFLNDTSRAAIANAKNLQNEAAGTETRLRSEGRHIYMKATKEHKEEMKKLKKQWEDDQSVANMKAPLDKEETPSK